ncbi:mannose-6-phosphate isomerase, partial [Carbonactinospora thermoautotrophica]
MTIKIEEAVLDDVEAMQAADAGQMLRAVASSGAQVRQAAIAAEEAGLARLREEGQPRAVVVAGMGGSGISGDVLAAVAGIGCRVPVVTLRDYTLPGWVGPMDLLIGVSCSGST